MASVVADVETDDIITVRLHGKDVGPQQQEVVVVAQVRVKHSPSGVGVGSSLGVQDHVWGERERDIG